VTFLSGLFLLALPLVAVPVLIHLYRGRQRDEIAWGAMQFLAQAATRSRSMERIEELLLLLLRAAAVAAIIFALARPMVRSSWWGSSGDREVVLVLDNSLSMSREVDGQSASDRMKEKAQAVIDNLVNGDEVHLLLASGGGQWLTAEGILADSTGKHRLRTMLENIEPTLGDADLLGCLQAVVPMEAAGQPASRRVVVLTDNQAKSWQLEAKRAWQQLADSAEKADVPTSMEIVDCSLDDAELDNLAVMRLDTSHKIVRPDEPLDFSAQITNAGQTPSEGVAVEWLIDDKVVGASPLPPLEPQETSQVTTTLRLEHRGIFEVSCRIDAVDQVPLDQQASVVVEVSDQIPILVVHDSADDDSSITAQELFTAALGYDGDQSQPWHSVYRPEVRASAALSSIRLSHYRAVVLTNLADLDRDSIDQLQAFVQLGGGLWLALGDRIDRETFNRNWYDDGDGLSPLPLERLDTVGDTKEPAGMIHPPSRDHPATAQLADTTQLDIDEARVREYWRLARGDNSEHEVSILLESGHGSPLVVENYVGHGRVLVQAFPLGLEWSNLPLLKAYVVMVHDWLDYLTAPAAARHNLAPGGLLLASAPSDMAYSAATLHAPDGREVPLVAQEAGDNATFSYSQTQLPGIYRVNFDTGGETVGSMPFYVARDPTESDLQPLGEEQRQKLFEVANLQFDANHAAQAHVADPVPREEPLWGALLVTLIVLLAGELLLSNWLARQRHGPAVSAG